MGVIIDPTTGMPYMGHLIPPARQPCAPRLMSTDQLVSYSDQDVIDIITDPSWVPAASIFDEHWVVEGDQKQHNSCDGWGGTNAFSEQCWEDGDQTGTVYSGSYGYSFCNGGVDQGAPLDKMMAELMANGTVPAAECTADMILRKQTSQFDTEAQQHKGIGLVAAATQAEVNTLLSQRKKVVVCIMVDRHKYVNYTGQGLVPVTSGHGNHCIHLNDIRWNATTKAFEYRQSGNWGITWGDKGTGWSSWAAYAQTIAYNTFYGITSTANLSTTALA